MPEKVRGRWQWDEGELAELKELYLGTYASVKEMARHFGVGITAMRWQVDYKDYRVKQDTLSRKWQAEHPERAREMIRKAQHRYLKRLSPAKRKAKKRQEQLYYYRTRERIRAQQKKYRDKKNKTL